MKSRYYMHAPNMVYALGPGDFENVKEAKASLRRFLNVKRLPRGSAVWKV